MITSGAKQRVSKKDILIEARQSVYAIHLLVIHGYNIGSLRNSAVCTIFCYVTNNWPKREL